MVHRASGPIMACGATDNGARGKLPVYRILRKEVNHGYSRKTIALVDQTTIKKGQRPAAAEYRQGLA